MITASHNEKNDNGFKMINREGEMMEEHYEEQVTDYVNGDTKDMENKRKSILDWGEGGTIMVGRDNRPSSKRL
jgi:phosphomannomutase